MQVGERGRGKTPKDTGNGGRGKCPKSKNPTSQTQNTVPREFSLKIKNIQLQNPFPNIRRVSYFIIDQYNI
jgi:hypothetical protein